MARRAGVSQSTVSLVLSGKSAGRISARTERSVREAAEALGYRPNVAARALRTGAARTVGLVVTDVTHPFFGGVMRGVQEAAWRAGYAVALVDVGTYSERQSLSFEALRAGPVDGFLFFTVDPPASTGEHVVAVEVQPPGMPHVRLDVEAGTDLAMGHLRELGHERIGHLASSIDAETFRLRAARLGDLPRATSAFDFEAARRAGHALLDDDGAVTAVFCDDDILAGGLYLAARERGLAIPDALSVVGFDDLSFARVLWPPLTTVRADPEALGATGFEVLAAAMAGEAAESRVLPVELVVRGSTGPPLG